ncbi:MAG: histidine kinase [candidate division Zixibacteria bacterium]
MYKLSRKFFLVCVPALFAVAALLMVLYQSTTTSAITELGERSNLSLAWATLGASRPQVVEFLEQSVGESQATSGPIELDQRFLASVRMLMDETAVIRVKIYDANGIVAYSTKPDQIGGHRDDNPKFLLGMQGVVSSRLIVSDSFDALEKRSESENLIQTYIPVQLNPTSGIVGVLEIYTNVDHLFETIEKTTRQVSIIGFCALVGLFVVLWWSITRAERTINRQRTIIAQRSHSLELLAERLSSAQEAERHRVSRELHEGLGQTLAAIKVQIEMDQGKSMPSDKKELVRLIQKAMTEVRHAATGLRPPSLDEAGPVSTISWYCRQFESIHPDIVVDLDLVPTDSQIPQRLTTAIYRIVQEVLRDLARFTDTHAVKISIFREDEFLKMTFRVHVRRIHDYAEDAEYSAASMLQRALAPLRERAILFGAQLTILQASESEIDVTCTWSVENVSLSPESQIA